MAPVDELLLAATTLATRQESSLETTSGVSSSDGDLKGMESAVEAPLQLGVDAELPAANGGAVLAGGRSNDAIKRRPGSSPRGLHPSLKRSRPESGNMMYQSAPVVSTIRKDARAQESAKARSGSIDDQGEAPLGPGPPARKRRRRETKEELAALYALYHARIPKNPTAKQMASEFADKELRVIVSQNGVLINDYNEKTHKYTEKTKVQKIETVLAMMASGTLIEPNALQQDVNRHLSRLDSVTTMREVGGLGALGPVPQGAAAIRVKREGASRAPEVGNASMGAGAPPAQFMLSMLSQQRALVQGDSAAKSSVGGSARMPHMHSTSDEPPMDLNMTRTVRLPPSVEQQRLHQQQLQLRHQQVMLEQQQLRLQQLQRLQLHGAPQHMGGANAHSVLQQQPNQPIDLSATDHAVV
jgi:hypothetical protein